MKAGGPPNNYFSGRFIVDLVGFSVLLFSKIFGMLSKVFEDRLRDIGPRKI